MNPGPQQTLTRTDIITGLRELIAELHTTEEPAEIRIIGGAAIALTINSDRAPTVDIDGPLSPAEPIRAAAAYIADRHGWRTDWINDAAAVFLPAGYGPRAAEWTTINDDGRVCIEVASPETLLAMKLHAMKLHATQRRGNRDAPDLAVLLPHCHITTTRDAEQLYEAHYPGDTLTTRTTQLIDRLLDAGAPTFTPPPLPHLD